MEFWRLAVFLSPFLKIGVHYLILKLTAAVCGIFEKKGLTDGADRGFFHSYGTSARHDRLRVPAAAHQHGVFF